MLQDLPFDLESLRTAYARGTSVAEVVGEVYRRIEAVDDPGIFIVLRSIADVLEEAAGLGSRNNPDKPLWGIPFVIKDNIDAARMPTTAACPAYAYDASDDAHSVKLLREAGALLIGKTNLDQFATGLVGVRTPFPVPRNAVDPKLVPGGSSSGSAVAVGHGLVTFSLGTDTAGSGRVPAGLNNVVGLKPTLGAISARGVVPACRTLDTVSVFALAVDDAYEVARLMAQFDPDDAFSKAIRFPPLSALPPQLRLGVPNQNSLRFYGDAQQEAAFEAAIGVVRSLGVTIVEIDLADFYEVAELLYTGSWVAERYTVAADLLEASPDAVHATTRTVIELAAGMTAADAFRDRYRLAELKRRIEPLPLDEPLDCSDPAVSCLPVEDPEPIEITLDRVTASLEQVWAADGTVWLLPGYAFANADGPMANVLAIPDEFLVQTDPMPMSEPAVDPVPEPMPAPAPGDTTVVVGGGVSGDPGDPAEPVEATILPFDESSVVGMPVDEATKVAEGSGWSVRVARQDGEDLALTMDFLPSRLNVAVEAGVITEVLSVG